MFLPPGERDKIVRQSVSVLSETEKEASHVSERMSLDLDVTSDQDMKKQTHCPAQAQLIECSRLLN